MRQHPGISLRLGRRSAASCVSRRPASASLPAISGCVQGRRAGHPGHDRGQRRLVDGDLQPRRCRCTGPASSGSWPSAIPSAPPIAPEIPTMIEAGVKGYEAYTFSLILGPAGMPQDVDRHARQGEPRRRWPIPTPSSSSKGNASIPTPDTTPERTAQVHPGRDRQVGADHQRRRRQDRPNAAASFLCSRGGTSRRGNGAWWRAQPRLRSALDEPVLSRGM